MGRFIYLVITMLFFTSCSKGEESGQGCGELGGVTDVTVTKSNLTVDISTDKACYKPGEAVLFTVDNVPADTKVCYRHLTMVIEETGLSSATWTWIAPSDDFTGYMVDLYQTESEGTEVILGSVAVDVSSDWTRFPRYGFVATFDQDKTEEVTREEMAYLNRHHINGVQFQDWHNKHHWPLGGTREKLDDTYTDIANRTIYTSSVKNYIKAQHEFGMKSMFYNLCFGALSDAAADGVKDEWYLFKDASHTSKDSHDLPSSWKSDIYLVNPANAEWQKYMAQRNDDVYTNLNFDGYQIDQLGQRGTLYDYSGAAVNLPKGYASFIEAMKTAHPDKRLVMNAVSSYGAKQIAETGKVDFLYNEVWNDEADFDHLKTIVKANNVYGSDKLKTVFAAYMNYNIADSKGIFNTPGVLLTDAVMFALGGSHLELGGEHMLCKEYFPNSNLSMNTALKAAMIHYYDFMTAYENLLRDGGSENVVNLSTTNAKVKLSAWPPKIGYVTALSKIVDNRQVIHLINFSQANNVSWRDLNGDMPEPNLLSALSLQLTSTGKVNKIWVASPDVHGGVPQELAFVQKDGTVSFVLPSLKYWSMVVLE
ncbi:MAG: Cycloisomaltooligosaccharide glucanotransferase precursor [Bacteroidetes bacterium]|nr:Cycloisomaltooligosaccharide glucanotransferase precursor [Bacteroidota bacterium]